MFEQSFAVSAVFDNDRLPVDVIYFDFQKMIDKVPHQRYHIVVEDVGSSS